MAKSAFSDTPQPLVRIGPKQAHKSQVSGCSACNGAECCNNCLMGRMAISSGPGFIVTNIVSLLSVYAADYGTCQNRRPTMSMRARGRRDKSSVRSIVGPPIFVVSVAWVLIQY